MHILALHTGARPANQRAGHIKLTLDAAMCCPFSAVGGLRGEAAGAEVWSGLRAVSEYSQKVYSLPVLTVPLLASAGTAVPAACVVP